MIKPFFTMLNRGWLAAGHRTEFVHKLGRYDVFLGFIILIDTYSDNFTVLPSLAKACPFN
jgi:hypothetical protein